MVGSGKSEVGRLKLHTSLEKYNYSLQFEAQKIKTRSFSL
jgi:hypothetical protein